MVVELIRGVLCGVCFEVGGQRWVGVVVGCKARRKVIRNGGEFVEYVVV